MSKSPVFPLRLLFLLPGFFLFACTNQPAHVGLSTDGYGFVKNSPHVAPPEHLTKGERLNIPMGDPAPYSPNVLLGSHS
ncbi:hypothetical protein FAI40_08805 [Acetobacteraceae bacterium]|nr:hypothetical protein FAI40_08805 [Acetobacteraceae bacterium]